MCLPVSRLFWVSSLAYPNLLGTKGYVVVVVEKTTDLCLYLQANIEINKNMLPVSC
jgi:hypothetical protein